MEDKIKNFSFPISVYGVCEQYNDVLSKARCRIFYKYENRNGTYITDQFADELLSSLPYAPVKGIYDYDDYSDHGTERTQGRIYGIVPENPNITWEDHLDEDGQTRTYACADVLIFTALYKEANQIIGKAQSMELYEPSLQYHSEIKNGQRYIVFDHGCFLGLQVLGDKVEPCFEGASFYTLSKSIEDVINKIKEYDFQGGKSKVQINFKLSDSQKESAIFDLLNPNFNEEGNWTLEYAIGEIYDDYALAYSYENGEAFRVYYTKDDTNNSIQLNKKVKCCILDVTEEEMQVLNALRALNGGTYECINPVLENAENVNSEYEKISAENVEMVNTISTLQAEAEVAKTEYSELVSTNATLEESVKTLSEYKANIELQQKESVISEYSDKLGEELLDSYRARFNEFSVLDLDKELAYELKKVSPTVFSNNTNGFLPKEQPLEGIEAILSRYKK